MFKYWGFGLKILSEIEFPELLSYDFDIEDVKIELGMVPLSPEVSQTSWGKMIIKPDSFLLDIDSTAKYLAIAGHRLIIEPYSAHIEPRTIRLYALATAMAGILAQRRLIPLHASGVLINEKLTLITGASTAGKSTVIAGLLKKGYTIFSDDIVVLNAAENNPIVAAAAYPMIKLWEDSIDKLQHNLFNKKTFRVRGDLKKFGFFFHHQFIRDTYPIERIIVLSKHQVPAITANHLQGFEAFNVLRKQLYRPFLFETTELQLLQFEIISALVNSCSVYSVVRPTVFDSDNLQAFIEELIGNRNEI